MIKKSDEGDDCGCGDQCGVRKSALKEQGGTMYLERGMMDIKYRVQRYGVVGVKITEYISLGGSWGMCAGAEISAKKEGEWILYRKR